MSEAGMIQSTSARANPYHNAWSESFMGSLKNEMLKGGEFETEADSRVEIFDYIESYYNMYRKHSSLGNCSPFQFETITSSNN